MTSPVCTEDVKANCDVSGEDGRLPQVAGAGQDGAGAEPELRPAGVHTQ